MCGRNQVSGFGILPAACLMVLCANSSWAIDLPAGPFADLKSEEFNKREAAQTALVDWARLRPEAAMDSLFEQSRVADDPEVRKRCLAVLRELVNDEYAKDGEGYIGIMMNEEALQLPDDSKPRGVIRVIEVVRESAGAKAGLKFNDLILGLDDLVWPEKAALQPFREKIRQLKPSSKITLNILRNDKRMSLQVILGRRPPMADYALLGEREVDPAAAERAAKEKYFLRWLERRKAGK